MNNVEATELAAEVTKSIHIRVAMRDGATMSSLGRAMNVDRNTVKNRLKSGNLSLTTFFMITSEIDCDPLDVIADAMDAVNRRSCAGHQPADGRPGTNRTTAPHPSRKGTRHESRDAR